MIVTCGVESAPHLPFHRARPLCRALTFPETDMADYFTHFSCVLDVGTPDNAARALDLYPAFMKEAARARSPAAFWCRFTLTRTARNSGCATKALEILCR